MKKTLKKRALPALAAVVCMLAAACSTGANDPPPQTAATPTAMPAAGEVADNTAITLATATTGAVIYYTQDGTEPNKNSALYSDSDKPAITTGKLTLKAIAVKDGMNNSATLTAVYTIAPPAPPDFGSESATVTLPAVSLTSSGAAIDLSTGVTADNLAWSCTTYTLATGVTTAYTPGEVTALINNAGTKNASVTVKKAGTYVFELTASNTGSTTVTKTVTVVVEPARLGVTVTSDSNFRADDATPVQTLNFGNLTYSPNDGSWGVFNQTKFTYNISAIKNDGDPINSLNVSGGVLTADNNFDDWPPPIITQTFSYDGKLIGNRSVLANAILSSGVLKFDEVYDVSDTEYLTILIKLPSASFNLEMAEIQN
jgi:hypothetical protein